MTRRTRKILFLFLLILFLIAAPLTVFYSLGWRFDWKTKRVIQPGVFYFKVWPKNVQIYLDNELKEKTDFFFGSVLVENLLSKKYDVEIKKEGFHTWEKTLEIRKREVTEAKNIVLIPENPRFTVMTKETKDFFFSPDGEKIILREEGDKKQGWALKLFELDKNVKSHLIDEGDISKEKVQLFDLKFSPNSKRVLLEVGVKEKLIYYLLEIDKVPALLTSLDFLNSDVEKVYFHPKNHQKLLVLLALTSETGEETRALSEVDLIDKKISLPVLENLITCSILNESIYYLDASGFLFKTGLSFNQEERLNIIAFPLKEEAKYEITASNSHILLEENDTLYIFDGNKKSFQKLFEPVKNFKFSPDSQKLVYFNDYEIWVLFLGKKYDQPQKEAGEQLFITRFSEKIDEVFWYTNHYLIFNAGDKIKIAEIDDRDKINIVDLTEFKEPKIFWSNKKLYILSEENLYVSEELTP
ncbi:WD40 repeat domain-containing protein [Patescibacteria group bacterium]|nr:WD40 repeat domain-containing protein [Patescibacteria group bacterium]